jgi:hypothetical protein
MTSSFVDNTDLSHSTTTEHVFVFRKQNGFVTFHYHRTCLHLSQATRICHIPLPPNMSSSFASKTDLSHSTTTEHVCIFRMQHGLVAFHYHRTCLRSSSAKRICHIPLPPNMSSYFVGNTDLSHSTTTEHVFVFRTQHGFVTFHYHRTCPPLS